MPSAEADGRKKKIYLIFKGLTPTEEPAKPGTIIYSSAKADGKRELAARGSALPVSSPVNLHLRFKLISTIMNFKKQLSYYHVSCI